MKRMFVMAILSGTLVIPGVATFAADGPPQGAPINQGPAAAPNAGQQGLAAPQGVAPQGNAPQQALAAPQGNPGPQGVAPQGNAGPVAGQQGINPNVAGQGFPGAAAGGAQDFLKGFKEMHGRMDGQVLGGPVVKDVKPMENSQSFVQYLFHFCRFRAAGFRCVPPMPMGFGCFMGGPAAPFGDLELLNVGMVSESTPAQGPVYRVTMANHSPVPAQFFRVSLVAVMGELNETAQVITVPVRFVGANATGTVDVQMPIGVMSMGNPGAPFERLIVVIDSFDELAETTKLNNVAVISRAEVVTVTVKTEAAAVKVEGAAAVKVEGTAAAAAPAEEIGPPAGGGPAPAAPAEGAAPAAPTDAQAAPVGPPQANATAPVQSGEQLDLDRVEGASQLLSR